MTISKFLPVFCALAAGTTCFPVNAVEQDNPAQAAARAALAKELFNSSTQQGTNVNVLVTQTNVTTIPIAPTPVAAAPTPAPAPVAAEPVPAPATVEAAPAAAAVATAAATPVPAADPKPVAMAEGAMYQCQAIWPLDQDSGSTVLDISGNGHNATVVGGPATWVKSDNANDTGLKLNGSSCVEVDAPVINTAQSFTVMARVKLATWEPKKYQTFVCIDGKEMSGFALQLNPYAGQGSGRFEFARLEGDAKGTTKVPVKAKGAITPNVWYDLAAVYNADAKEISLYVNGNVQETAPYTSAWQAKGKTAIGRGQNNGRDASYFKGTIRDVRLYASALTADQIKKAADATAPSVNALVSAPVSQPQPATTTPTPAPAAAPVVVAQVAAPVVAQASTPAPQSQVSIRPEGTDNPAQAAARIALAKALFGSAPATSSTTPAFQSQPRATTVSASQSVVVARPASTGTDNYIGQNLGLRPIAAPALPISASKQEQLSALLAKYMADQITPEEYHRQRAAILTQP